MRKAEIKKFITRKMKTNLEKNTIYTSSSGVIHIHEEFKEKSPSHYELSPVKLTVEITKTQYRAEENEKRAEFLGT